MRPCLILILCSFLFLLGCGQKEPVLHDTQGQAVRLSELKGKWVIVNYWAVWCGACLQEIPELNNFYAHHLHDNIILYGVNYERSSLENLKEVMHKVNIHFPVLQEDPHLAWNLNDISVIPATFIINPEGKVVKTLLGPNSEKSLTRVLKELYEL